MNIELTIQKYRGKFAIFAGAARLSSCFKTEQAAVAELESDRDMYMYWAGSAGVSIQNTPARVVIL